MDTLRIARISIVMLAFGCQRFGSTHAVRGVVRDSTTGELVTSGQVGVLGTAVVTDLGKTGTFSLAIPRRDVELRIRSIGFKPRNLTVHAGDSVIDVALSRDYFKLGPFRRDSTDYGFQVTRKWGQVSTLGDLRSLPFGPADVELRLWAGYGLQGDHGLVIRKRGAVWSAFVATVIRCWFEVPPQFVNQSRAALRVFEDSARAHCITDGGRFRGPQTFADSVAVRRLEGRDHLDALLRDVERAGIWTLPRVYLEEGVMTDGHGWGVEVRKGDDYLLTQIRCIVPPDVDMYQVVQRIDSLMASRLRPPFWPKCDY